MESWVRILPDASTKSKFVFGFAPDVFASFRADGKTQIRAPMRKVHGVTVRADFAQLLFLALSEGTFPKRDDDCLGPIQIKS